MSFALYDLLLARADCAARVQSVVLGLSWSMCQADGVGLCFSPTEVPRTLPWAGTLAGRQCRELAPWIRSFEPAQAAVGALVVNASVNLESNPLLLRSQPVRVEAPGHLSVFAHFLPLVRGASVAVVGRYPGLDELWSDVDYRCLERRAGPDTLPDTAAEYVLPECEWVFLTGSAIANKTLPRLLTLSQKARVVLMGPSVPWLEEWADFGVDYLAGVRVVDPARALQVVAEGGGTRLFTTAVEYRLAQLR